MNWEFSFTWQDSNDRTMSPDFSSTTQDNSWEPWIHRDRHTKWSFVNCTHFSLQKKAQKEYCPDFYISAGFYYICLLPIFISPPALSKRAFDIFPLSKGMCWWCLFQKLKMVTMTQISYWANVTCHSLGSNGVRGHWGHTHSCRVDPTHSEHVASALHQTCYLGDKQTRKQPFVGEVGYTSLNHQFGQIWQAE